MEQSRYTYTVLRGGHRCFSRRGIGDVTMRLREGFGHFTPTQWKAKAWALLIAPGVCAILCP